MKRFHLIIFILSALIMFSSCTKLELDYVIEENGTIDASYLIAVEDQAGKFADIQHLIDAAWQQAEINDFSLSTYHEEGYSGFQATKTMRIEDFRQAEKQMLGFEILPSIITDYSWHYEPSVFQNIYRLKMDMDLRNIVDQTALDALPSDLTELAQEALTSSEVRIHITLPGQPENTNAEQISQVKGNNATRYSWTLHPGEYKTLVIEATLDRNRTKNQLLWGIGAVVAVLIISISSCVIRKIRKNRPKHNRYS